MSVQKSHIDEKGHEHQEHIEHTASDDDDGNFGGPEARSKLEKKFLLKLDLRMSVSVVYMCKQKVSDDVSQILVIIYILNYVGMFY